MIKIIVLSFMVTNVLGQAPGMPSASSILKKIPDTSLKVVYTAQKIHPEKKPPAYFINGQAADPTMVQTLDNKKIDSIYVVRTNKLSDSSRYYGEIYITTKSGWNPSLISLTGLREKYTNVKSKNVLFMIDGQFVNEDFDKSLVDEKYLLRIIVQPVKNLKENINLFLISLLTRSEANIKQIENEVTIRGGLDSPQ